MAATMKHSGFLTVFLCLLELMLMISGQLVKDLTDQLGPWKQKDQAWLVMFHAPWCGHCRQLAPTYHRVGQELLASDINVGKLDCTSYGHIAGQYDVRGFPTLKYIHGDSNFTHRGERSRDDIIEFTRRAHGPAVREIANYAKFVGARSAHSEGVFFMYVGGLGPDQELLVKFNKVAEKHRIYSYFYKGEPKVLPKDIKVESPSILVFKDKSHLFYKPGTDAEATPTLSDWVSGERYTAFPRIEGANLNEVAEMKKLLVIVTVDGLNKKDRIKDIAEELATKKMDIYHEKFQFVWMSNNDAIDSMTMSSMPYPFLMVLNPDTQMYYLPEGSMDDINIQKFEQFLRKVEKGKMEAFGGTGVLERIKRVFYDLLTSIYSVWLQSRILFFVMFGVPSMLISVVCYGLCCMDTADDEYERVDEDDFGDSQEENPSETTAAKSIEEKKVD